MKVTISELRTMIREALEETTMETVGKEEERNRVPPTDDMGSDTGLTEEMANEGWGEMEEAWGELEEVSGLAEAASKKEEKKPAKKEEKKAEVKEKPKAERKESGMQITKAQLMKALDLNPAQEMDFKRAINKGHSVADALAAATKKKDAKKED